MGLNSIQELSQRYFTIQMKSVYCNLKFNWAHLEVNRFNLQQALGSDPDMKPEAADL